MCNIKAILFDFDGTLDDSTIPGLNWIIDKAKRLGLSVPEYDFVRKLWGMPYEEVLDKIKSKYHWSNVELERYSLETDDFKKFAFPFKGLNELMEDLYKKGILLGIISSRTRNSLLARLEDCQIDQSRFYIIQGFEDCMFYKPDKRVFDYVLGLLGAQEIKVSNIIYVGDTLFDFMASNNANLKFVGITSGATTKEEFIEAGLFEKYIFDNPVGIRDILNLS